MTDSVDRLAIATPTDERTDELRTVGEIQPSLTSSDARARIPKAQAALEADPFLPAIERLQRDRDWVGLNATDVVALMRGEDCHPRPMFELIPDHPSGCECVYSSHDAARWRPL